MLSEELKSIRQGLGDLLGRVDTDSAELLRAIRRNLDEAIDQASCLEENLCPKEVA